MTQGCFELYSTVEEIISSKGNPVSVVKEPEWVFVPERIEIADERADYNSMQLIGDTVCYISRNGETEEET